MRKQRLLGLALVAISAATVLLASIGTTLEEQDVTAVFFTLPLGIYAMVTKQYILNDRAEPEDEVTSPTKGAEERSKNYGKKAHH